MEPLVIVAAAIVIYCFWLALMDELRDWGLISRHKSVAKSAPPAVVTPQAASRAVCPRDAVGVRWPVHAKGSA